MRLLAADNSLDIQVATRWPNCNHKVAATNAEQQIGMGEDTNHSQEQKPHKACLVMHPHPNLEHETTSCQNSLNIHTTTKKKLRSTCAAAGRYGGHVGLYASYWPTKAKPALATELRRCLEPLCN